MNGEGEVIRPPRAGRHISNNIRSSIHLEQMIRSIEPRNAGARTARPISIVLSMFKGGDSVDFALQGEAGNPRIGCVGVIVRTPLQMVRLRLHPSWPRP